MSADTRPALGGGLSKEERQAAQTGRWRAIWDWVEADPASRDLKLEVIGHQAQLLEDRGIIEATDHSALSLPKVIPHLNSIRREHELTGVVAKRRSSKNYRSVENEFNLLGQNLVPGEKATNPLIASDGGDYWTGKAKIEVGKKLLTLKGRAEAVRVVRQ